MRTTAAANYEQVIAVLAEAERTRTAIGPVSDLIEGGLTLEDAHKICETAIARRVHAGDPVVGFKIGFTNIPVREKMGLPDSTYGYLLQSMVLKTGAVLAISDFVGPRIETELCLRIARDIRVAEPTTEDALAAIDAVIPAFEICDARIKDWKCPYPDFFADNGFSARIVTGETWTPIAGFDLLAESVDLLKNGEKIAEGRGEMALGHPANAVAWLARRLHERGLILRAGMLVMTGTLTPILPIDRGASYEARYSTLGSIKTRFE